MTELDYKQIYADFLENYKKGAIDGESVGEIIVRIVQCFAAYNLKTANAEITFNIKAAEIEQSKDPLNFKFISSSKAKILANATDEYSLFLLNRAHLNNIEQYINALKSLQKGILQEWQHMGVT